MFMSGHDKVYEEKYMKKEEREARKRKSAETHAAEEIEFRNKVRDAVETMDTEADEGAIEGRCLVEGALMETADGMREGEKEEPKRMEIESDAYSSSDDEWTLQTRNSSSAEPFVAISNASHVALLYPRKLMESTEICTAADRLKLTDNQATCYAAAFLKACKADLGEFSLSRKTTQRKRSGNIFIAFNSTCFYVYDEQ